MNLKDVPYLQWYSEYSKIKKGGSKYIIGYELCDGNWRYVSSGTIKGAYFLTSRGSEYRTYHEIIRDTAPQKIRFRLKTLDQGIVSQFMNTVLGSCLFKSFLNLEDVSVYYTGTAHHVIINNYYMADLKAVYSVYRCVRNIFPNLLDEEIYRDGYPFLLKRTEKHYTVKVPIVLGMGKGKFTHEGTFRDSFITYVEGCNLLELRGDELMVVNEPSTSTVMSAEASETHTATNGPKTHLDIFIQECCRIQENTEIKVDDLYALYINWCNSMRTTAYSKIHFCREINKRGFKSKQIMKAYKRYRIFQNILTIN